MKRLNLLLVVAATCLHFIIPATGAAQTTGPDTLEVELRLKTSAHPFYGRGSDSAYFIDGVEAKELTFVRGQRYVFHMNPMKDSTYALYISTSELGAGRKQQYQGLPKRGWAFEGEYFPYVPTPLSPDLVYYQAIRHEYVGWKIHIVDELSSSAPIDRGLASQGEIRARAWFAEDGERLLVQHALSASGELRVELYDAIGQRVGVHDLGGLAAGERVTSIELPSLSPGFYVYRVSDPTSGAAVTGTMRTAR